MTPQEERLLHPAPGSAIAAARDFGVDLTLLIERLHRTHEQRLLDLQALMDFHGQIRGAARSAHDPAPRDPAATGRG